jgi:peptidoglycan hydrolase-like protein with peptidoglycan-binding domain
MKTRTWLCYVGAVLIVSAAPAAYGAPAPVAAQSSASRKKKTASKSKKKPKISSQKAPTADRIREIQSALKQQGAYDGEPTGKWDDSTVDAMKKYQENRGLNPTGKIDALTLNKLGLGSGTAGKGAPTPTASSTDPSSSPSAR